MQISEPLRLKTNTLSPGKISQGSAPSKQYPRAITMHSLQRFMYSAIPRLRQLQRWTKSSMKVTREISLQKKIVLRNSRFFQSLSGCC